MERRGRLETKKGERKEGQRVAERQGETITKDKSMGNAQTMGEGGGRRRKVERDK